MVEKPWNFDTQVAAAPFSAHLHAPGSVTPQPRLSKDSRKGSARPSVTSNHQSILPASMSSTHNGPSQSKRASIVTASTTATRRKNLKNSGKKGDKWLESTGKISDMSKLASEVEPIKQIYSTKED